MAMEGTKESDLVTAVLFYAMRCLAEGDQAALRNMNFGIKEIEALRGRIKDAEESIAEADKKRAELVEENDRLDNIAARFYSDPGLYWRLCDANGAMNPPDLVTQPGRRLRITLPDGIPEPTNDS